MASEINTHGIKIDIDALERAAAATVNNPHGSSYLFYDTSNGEVWETWEPNGNWAECKDPDVVFIMATPRHVSAQRIADAISDTLEEAAWLQKELEGYDWI